MHRTLATLETWLRAAYSAPAHSNTISPRLQQLPIEVYGHNSHAGPAI